MSRKVVWIGGALAAAVVLGAAIAYAVVFNEKVIVNGDLEVRGVGGYADFSLSWVDPFYGDPWMAMRDKGTTPSELEIAPIPNQYDQITLKTWVAILGKGTAPPGALVDTPPFDARLLMSGPWPDWTYCALRDDGMAPGTLEVNPLAQYRDIEATIKNTGMFRILDSNGQMLFEVDGAEGECPKWREQTGYVTISPTAWQPRYMNTGYEYRGAYATIVELVPPLSSYAFYVPVQLPHGCTVKSITWYWYDTAPSTDINFSLFRHTLGLGGTASTMAQGNSTGSSGLGSTTDATVDLATIDNSQHSYSVRGTANNNDPSYEHWLQEVKIEYTYTGPH